jgi:hypothetical protein
LYATIRALLFKIEVNDWLDLNSKSSHKSHSNQPIFSYFSRFFLKFLPIYLFFRLLSVRLLWFFIWSLLFIFR